MPKPLQTNVTANCGSHRRIAERIEILAIGRGWKSFIFMGKSKPSSESKVQSEARKVPFCFFSAKLYLCKGL